MILVLNCGSQSIKWKVFDNDLIVIQEGKRVILEQDNFSAQGGPASGWQKILQEELGKIDGTKIDLIGHRVVHGKDIFIEPTKITDKNLIELEKLNYLAPLHNHFNVLGIKACQRIFGGVPQVAVFDTEFFKDLPEKAATYALPESIVKELGFRRYGFHGISHEYVASAAAKAMADKKKSAKRIITVHLGGGASITAIKNGKAVDTSMGFTPMQGLVMMTRAGDMDVGIVLELVKKFGIERVQDILNKESGIKGICGEGDMLKVLSALGGPASGGEKKKYQLALDVFVYSIQKYIGSYYAILGGCDLLVFTGAIGFGSKKIRDMICRNLDILKKTKVLFIENNEELAIAQKIIKLK